MWNIQGCCILYINEKTMTSKEVLNASVLDIVFDNRNKQYGAYTLRKFYGNRLGIALAVALSSVFLICLLIARSVESVSSLLPPVNPEVVVDFIEPLTPATPPTPPAKQISKPATKSTELFVPEIVPTQQVTNPLPDINTLNSAENINAKTLPGGSNGPGGPGITPVTSVLGPVTKTEGSDKEVPLMQRKPQFPGGEAAWMEFLRKWLEVPEEIASGERKTVVVQFQVSEEGMVTNFQILRSAGRSFDNEVMRVLKKMPRWEPAVQNNRKVATTFQQPVTFTSYEN
jgi:periplasmic protein TonB